MGMKPGKDGALAPERGYLTERIKELPEMSRPEMPTFTIIEYNPLIDSSCMGPKEWIKICTDIEANYFKYDGFVVIMGTDTMAYASSAVSFMLENLGKTVVFTGSQIPFCEVYNDARRNLIVSVIFAATSDFPEVCVCFNDSLFRANRTVKVDSGSLAAFDSPNFPALATLGAVINERKDLALPQPRGPFKAHITLESNVIVLKLVPGFDDESIFALINNSKKLRAIVIEMYGKWTSIYTYITTVTITLHSYLRCPLLPHRYWQWSLQVRPPRCFKISQVQRCRHCSCQSVSSWWRIPRHLLYGPRVPRSRGDRWGRHDHRSMYNKISLFIR